MLPDQGPNDASPSEAIKLTSANIDDEEVIRVDMSPANETAGPARPMPKDLTNKATVTRDMRDLETWRVFQRSGYQSRRRLSFYANRPKARD